MSKIVNSSYRHLFSYCKTLKIVDKLSKRTFLSNAYYCQESWNARLKSPILQQVRLDELYYELDNNYNKIKNISAVDVDIFVNAIQNDGHIDELLDLIHKLRLSADTGNTLPSTEHAVIRCLSECGQYEKLLQVLDDRLNYGIFLDNYTACLLLDTFWKKNDFTSGAKVASQLMLQEDFSHPFARNLSLLHCFKFLQNPVNWEEPPKPQEPAEEIKIRVKFLRNPYFDGHFDLENPMQIVGKTVVMAADADQIGNTFKIVGLALQNKNDEAKGLLGKTPGLVKEIVDLLPDDNEIKIEATKLKLEDLNVCEILESKIKEAEKKCSQTDIAEQCKTYENWMKLRQDALEKQQKRLDTIERLAKLEEKQDLLKQREKLLWYNL